MLYDATYPHREVAWALVGEHRIAFHADVVPGLDVSITIKIDVNPNHVISTFLGAPAAECERDFPGAARGVRDVMDHLFRDDLGGSIGAAYVLKSNPNSRSRKRLRIQAEHDPPGHP